MKHKKILSLVVACVLALCLTACGSKGGDTKTGSGSEQAQTSAQTSGGKKRVALLVGALGDLSFNDSAHAGLTKAQKDFGDKIEYKVIEYSDDASKVEPTLIDAAEAGYDIVISPPQMQEVVEQYAPDYPNTTFIIFDSDVDWTKGDLKNVYTIVYKANEASYLGGYLAAKMSDTGVIGFLGGTDQPIISDFLVGYVQGAKDANPNIRVTTSYVGSWSDSPKGKELSLAMYNQNASMIFNVAGGSGNGLIEAGLEKGRLVLGVDSDQALLLKNNGEEKKAELIPTSVLKNVGDSLYRAVDLYLKGELPLGKNESLGMKEGGVGLADNEYFQKLVPEDLRKDLKSLEEKIVKGEIKVDTAYGKSTDEINKIRESIRP